MSGKRTSGTSRPSLGAQVLAVFFSSLRKIVVQRMSGKAPGNPSNPSSRHPRPPEWVICELAFFWDDEVGRLLNKGTFLKDSEDALPLFAFQLLLPSSRVTLVSLRESSVMQMAKAVELGVLISGLPCMRFGQTLRHMPSDDLNPRQPIPP